MVLRVATTVLAVLIATGSPAFQRSKAVRPEISGRERARIEADRAREQFDSVHEPVKRAKFIEKRVELWDRVRHHERARTYDALSRYTKGKVSELIAEREMTSWLHAGGFKPLVSVQQSSHRPQGFDAVYEKGGFVVVCEAKGTAKPERLDHLLKVGYGEKQGSFAWAREAAESILTTRSSNRKEIEAAERILDAVEQKKLKVLVFVTTHRRGVVYDASNSIHWNPVDQIRPRVPR